MSVRLADLYRAHGHHTTLADSKSIRHPRQCRVRLCARNLLHLLYSHPRRDRNQETRRGSHQSCDGARGDSGLAIYGTSTNVLSSTPEVTRKDSRRYENVWQNGVYSLICFILPIFVESIPFVHHLYHDLLFVSSLLFFDIRIPPVLLLH